MKLFEDEQPMKRWVIESACFDSNLELHEIINRLDMAGFRNFKLFTEEQWRKNNE